MVAQSTETVGQLIQALEHSRLKLQRCVAGLDEETCSARPGGVWSITENLEHLAIVEKRVASMLPSRLPGIEPAGDLKAPSPEHDLALAERIAVRIDKAQAPEPVVPSGRYPSCAQALEAFSNARQQLIGAVPTLEPYLRGRYIRHLLFGPLDGYQWILFLSAHTERHIKQIEDTKAAIALQ